MTKHIYLHGRSFGKTTASQDGLGEAARELRERAQRRAKEIAADVRAGKQARHEALLQARSEHCEDELKAELAKTADASAIQELKKKVESGELTLEQANRQADQQKLGLYLVRMSGNAGKEIRIVSVPGATYDVSISAGKTYRQLASECRRAAESDRGGRGRKPAPGMAHGEPDEFSHRSAAKLDRYADWLERRAAETGGKVVTQEDIIQMRAAVGDSDRPIDGSKINWAIRTKKVGNEWTYKVYDPATGYTYEDSYADSEAEAQSKGEAAAKRAKTQKILDAMGPDQVLHHGVYINRVGRYWQFKYKGETYVATTIVEAKGMVESMVGGFMGGDSAGDFYGSLESWKRAVLEKYPTAKVTDGTATVAVARVNGKVVATYTEGNGYGTIDGKTNLFNVHKELQAGRKARSDQERGATHSVYRIKKDGTRSSTPTVSGLTAQEAAEKVIYLEGVNPGTTFVSDAARERWKVVLEYGGKEHTHEVMASSEDEAKKAAVSESRHRDVTFKSARPDPVNRSKDSTIAVGRRGTQLHIHGGTTTANNTSITVSDADRLIDTIHGTNAKGKNAYVKIYKQVDVGEYVCKLYLQQASGNYMYLNKADYFTDDLPDAKATAKMMIEGAV